MEGPSFISKCLDELVKSNCSDMYLTVGRPASIRSKDNKLIQITSALLTQSDIDHILHEVLDDEKREEFESTLELNVPVAREDKTRFRFNFFRQQQNSGIVIRRINTKIPTMAELGLPDVYAKMAMKKRGLIILASPGGSGKSTSMAAMIGHRNSNSAGHILTIEDPIEYVHEHQQCIITQREVGTDTFSYGMALKNALRQRADVIAIGEIRDRDAMDHALRFAETGHLCIATLHSNNASQAIDRIVNFFSEDARAYILTTLSQNLLSIFSQRLVPNLMGGNSLAVDVLLNEGLIRNLIAEDKITEIKDALERGYDAGMRTFDQSLYDLLMKNKISLEVALAEAENPASLKLKLNQNNASPVEMLKAEEEKRSQF
ncbi:MAG: PilT/PilU family type 4a pilus ATPase [Rickettsiaceae bacterium]|jgi:twitching motility protein PilU|nr:PilT/PilU family type 4a pilus ATPase [Rickettsiaceae bacterium]